MRIDSQVAVYFSMQLLRGLLRHVSLERLETGVTPAQVAELCGTTVPRTRSCLQYLVATLDFIEQSGSDRFCLSMNSATSRFRLLKYLAAYGKAVDGAWENEEKASARTDDVQLAAAYRELAALKSSKFYEILAGRPCRHVLELGCGTAPVLRELARHDSNVTGCGVDANPHIARLATEMIAAEGLSSRLRIVEASLTDVAAGTANIEIPPDTIVLRGVLNSMFEDGNHRVVEFLRLLSAHYPAARIVISDYYGGLGHGAKDVETLNQDLVQVLSGQGVPPSMPATWDRIYRAAGLERIKRVKDDSMGGILQFVDIVVRV